MLSLQSLWSAINYLLEFNAGLIFASLALEQIVPHLFSNYIPILMFVLSSPASLLVCSSIYRLAKTSVWHWSLRLCRVGSQTRLFEYLRGFCWKVKIEASQFDRQEQIAVWTSRGKVRLQQKTLAGRLTWMNQASLFSPMSWANKRIWKLFCKVRNTKGSLLVYFGVTF